MLSQAKLSFMINIADKKGQLTDKLRKQKAGKVDTDSTHLNPKAEQNKEKLFIYKNLKLKVQKRLPRPPTVAQFCCSPKRHV